MLANVSFDQVVDAIYDQAASRLLLLFSRISPIKPGSKDLLGLCARHRQGNATVWADGIFAQSRTGAGDAVHHNEYLPALWRDLHAKPRQACVPMDGVPRLDRQVIDDGFRQTGTGNRRLLVLLSSHIGSTEWARLEQLSNHNPRKSQEKCITINLRQSPGKTRNVDSESARERTANPPAGTAPAPPFGLPPEGGLRESGCRFVS
jgi:hypothetical protein